MAIERANGVQQEWCRVKVMVVTHDDGLTWRASTPQWPGLTGDGAHPDVAASRLLEAMARRARDVTVDVQRELKDARAASRRKR